MTSQPKGTVSFLFTDIEGSTKLLHAIGRARYGETLRQHQQMLRDVWECHHGYEVHTEGDAFFVAFERASQAVAAAADAQRTLAQAEWVHGYPVRVRIGGHSGEATADAGNYVGVAVHRAARIAAAAHGGQTLFSETTKTLCADEDVPGVRFRDLGLHRLKDLTEPQRLYQLVIEGRSADFPPPKTLESRPTNLPSQPTPLIGRQQELREIGRLLLADSVRLLTLTGAGGTGKTRLALHAAADEVDQFRDGVFVVALASITEPLLVVPAIAQTIGVREAAGEPLEETLSEYLRAHEMLLVLDNFEHLLCAASLLSELLQRAPKLKLIVTSRAPLHLRGEQEYAVEPLPVPRESDVAAVSACDSVRLFVGRAQAVKPDFELTSENAAAVAEICERLDGLPLAIELAAARVRVLPPASLLVRLDRCLRLLTGGAADSPTRQQTLRGAIDWSYGLLSGEEQQLFARVSVFSGGFSLEAAEAVCDPQQELEVDVLDGLSSLVEKNLLRQREDVSGEARFSMLETIREHARERLEEEGCAGLVRSRHAEFFLRVSAQAAEHLEGGEHQSDWMRRLEQERSNLNVALDFWRCEPEKQLAFAASLVMFWGAREYWQEGRRWLDEALAATTRATQHRLAALDGAYYFSYRQGDDERPRDVLEEMLPLAQRLGNRKLVARALTGLSHIALADGDRDRAAALAEESLSYCAGERDSVYPLGNLGFDALYRNDLVRARAFFEQGLEVVRRHNDQYAIADGLALVALVNAFMGENQSALNHLQEAIELATTLGSRETLIRRCVPALAALRMSQGQADESVKLIGCARTWYEDAGWSSGGTLGEVERRLLVTAEERLDHQRIANAMDEGRLLTLEQALACVFLDPAAPKAT